MPDHKIKRDRYRELAATPYVLKPGDVYQIPGTKHGVKLVDSGAKAVLLPIAFDTLREERNTTGTT